MPAPVCEHCHSPIPAGAELARFCCRGCEVVHGLLVEQGLERYYELAGARLRPVSEATSPRSRAWLGPLVERAEQPPGPLCALQLDVQGLECAACVWLLNETFRRRPGAADITVNPSLGQVQLRWQRGACDVAAWVNDVEAFGYTLGPARKTSSAASSSWPLRLGVCVALTINVMLFSLSFYFGLSRAEPEVFSLFTWLSFALSTGVVAVGGWPFFQAAVRGLRRGLLHLDVPIAVGIALVYAVSLVQLREGRGDLTYLDTLNTFITLMVLGRFLQERVLERNRRFLLEDDGADGLVARRVEGQRLSQIPVSKVAAGDVLLVTPGDLVPVESSLVEPSARIRLDWVTGESDARDLTQGNALPAGSFNAGTSAFHAVAQTTFADSPLVALLRQTRADPAHVPRHQQLWDQLARRWVGKVLLVASAGFVVWLPEGLSQATNVAVSLLVITCPCAVGLAVPLAYELTQSALRRQGFFVRSADLLDRLTQIKKVIFDKTGTLTLGRLELTSPPRLDATARDVAYTLASRSNHPVSACVARALERQSARYLLDAEVHEVAGRGVEWRRADGTWRLGRADWATGSAARHTVLARDGQPLDTFMTREVLRPGAARELASLEAEGRTVWLLSGDTEARVRPLASTLGVPPERALADLKPEEKAERVRRIDEQDTLYLGDGVNDALAFAEALAAGTPAIDRPVMPGKSDFFLVGEGLAPLREALARAAQLRRVVQRVLALSVSYNAFAIALALLGKMSPAMAAITMPASTLTLLTLTVVGLRRDATPAPLEPPAQTLRPARSVA